MEVLIEENEIGTLVKGTVNVEVGDEGKMGRVVIEREAVEGGGR